MGKNDSISIPVILKVGPNALDGLGKCLADEDLKQVVIYFGNGLIDLFGMKVMESLKESGVSVLEYRELDTVDGLELTQSHAQCHCRQNINFDESLSSFIVTPQRR